MATACFSISSITEIIGMYTLGNHEIRLYRACKAIFNNSEVRREWWQHVKFMKHLPLHLSPATAPRSWQAFVSWRNYVYGGVLPAYPPYFDMTSDEEHDGSSENYVWSESSDDTHEPAFEYMTGFGPRGGPPCNRCRQLPSVFYSDLFGLMCHRCHQSDTNRYLIEHWSMIYRTHPLLGDTGITRHIAEFLWGDVLSGYCSCGECNPNWFLCGWVCYDCN